MNQRKKVFKGNLKKLSLLAALIACLISGFFLVFYSWDGKVYVSLGETAKSRKLATDGDGPKKARSCIEISRKNRSELAPRQLFVKSRTGKRRGGLLEFYLGDFIISDKSQGTHFFVCDLYDSVELTFQGQDTLVSGTPGTMVLKAPCLRQPVKHSRKSQQQTTSEQAPCLKQAVEGDRLIGPFYFPLAGVLSHPDKMEFALKEKDTLVRFYNMTPAVNSNWLLIVARFFNSSNNTGSYPLVSDRNPSSKSLKKESNEDGFFVTFTPGEESPYFELQF